MNKILVLKVGTNTLVHKNGSETFNQQIFLELANQIKQMRAQGYEVVLVSSGAITAGMMHTNTPIRPEQMIERQRLAGIGWPIVATKWSESLSGVTVFSTLLTRRELGSGQPTRQEALDVINVSLQNHDVVLVNENDVITHEEIEFGDNDTLAAVLAAQLKVANPKCEVTLMLLSDINGLRADKDDPATVIRTVERLEDVSLFAKGSRSPLARGGMITKLRAAQIAAEGGVLMYVTDGSVERSIMRTLKGEIGTCFRLQ